MSMTAILSEPRKSTDLRSVTRIKRLSIEAKRTLREAKRIASEFGPTAPEVSTTYTTLCISTYPEDLQLIDSLVEKMKAAGITRANRSLLIRMAIRQVEIAALIQLAQRAK